MLQTFVQISSMKVVYAFLVGLCLTSCTKNPDNPSWLKIEPWTLNDNPDAVEGELTHKFSDAWVYVDNELMGVFELPVKLPILKKGNLRIKVFPTIQNNGISATKKIYPFVDFYETQGDFSPSDTVVVLPSTQYINDLTYWIEDFEDASIKIQEEDESLAAIVRANDQEHLKYGQYFGKVSLNTTDTSWIAVTTDQFFPPKTSEVYLEVDYKSTNSVVTGVLELSSQGNTNHVNIQINPQAEETAEWRKIYIDLRDIIRNTPNAEAYKLTFLAYKDADKGSSELILDNLKFIYY